jgi:two-component system LytT family response regulator
MEVRVSIVDTEASEERAAVRIPADALDADTVARIVTLLVTSQTDGIGDDQIPVKNGKHTTFVDPDEIDWVKAEGNYVLLYCGGRSHIVRERIAALEERLDPARFRRIHRSAIVNLDRIRELRAREHGGYDVVLADGTHLEVSRRYANRLLPG